jgi:putative membrane protein
MMGFGFFGIGMLLMVAFWVLVIGGGVWLVMTLVRGNQNAAASNQPYALMTPPATTSNSTPLDILKARYAKGEITQEQFEEMRRALGV